MLNIFLVIHRGSIKTYHINLTQVTDIIIFNHCFYIIRESRLGNAMAGIVCVRRVVFKSFEQKDVVLNRLIVFVQLIKCKT